MKKRKLLSGFGVLGLVLGIMLGIMSFGIDALADDGTAGKTVDTAEKLVGQSEEDFVMAIVPVRQEGRSGEVNFVKGRNIPYTDWLDGRNDTSMFEQPYNNAAHPYSTNYFTVNGKIAYCIESHRPAPSTSSQVAEEYNSNVLLQKVLYYGYGGPGDITGNYFGQYSDDEKYILTHIAASYTYLQGDKEVTDEKTGTNFAFYGCSRKGMEIIQEFTKHLETLPAPGEIKLDLQPESMTAQIDYITGEQKTAAFTLNGDQNSYIEFSVPDDMKCWVDSEEGQSGTVRVNGGQSFSFTADKNKSGIWSSGKVSGNYTNIWRTLVISNNKSQDIGYAEFYEESDNAVQFQVKWNNVVNLKIRKTEEENENIRLQGVEFGIYGNDNCSEDSLICSAITDVNGEASVFINPEVYSKIYLKELKASDGYCISDVITVSIGKDGVVESQDTDIEDNIVVIHDALRKIEFAKVGPKSTEDNPEYVPGAKMEVRIGSEDGNVAETVDGTKLSWTSGDAPKSFEGIKKGIYYLVEVEAPSGYCKAKAVRFEITGEVSASDKPVLVTMADCMTKVQITKTFESVDGRTYSINDKQPVVFEIYQKGSKDEKPVRIVRLVNDEPYVIEGMEVGKYLFKEVAAPDGFTLAKETEFEVTSEMQGGIAVVTKIEVTNTATDFKVSKVDAANVKQGLDGAQLEILSQETGEIAVTVYGETLSWVSEKNVKEIKGLAAGKYILREAKAPQGYECAEDILFEIKADGEIISKALNEKNVLVIKDTAIKGSKSTGNSKDKTVKTGDNTLTIGYIITAVAAAAIIFSLLAKKRRNI